jgi:hypothetical protein
MEAGETGLGNGETREPGTESQQLSGKQNGGQRRGGTGNAEQESLLGIRIGNLGNRGVGAGEQENSGGSGKGQGETRKSRLPSHNPPGKRKQPRGTRRGVKPMPRTKNTSNLAHKARKTSGGTFGSKPDLVGAPANGVRPGSAGLTEPGDRNPHSMETQGTQGRGQGKRR